MVKLSVSQAVPICMCGFKSRLAKFSFFFTASSYQIHVVNNLVYSMELMKALEEVHVWDEVEHNYMIGIGCSPMLDNLTYDLKVD